MADIINIVGRKPVIELINQRVKSINSIYLVNDLSYPPEIVKTLEKVEVAGVSVKKISRDKFIEEFNKFGNHQWIVAETRRQEAPNLEALLERSSKSGCGVILALDQVQDPHNVGAILRLAAAAGIDGVILPADRSSPVTDAARRVSAGASEIVPQCVVKNLARALETARAAGFWIVGSDLSDASVNLYSATALSPLVIVLGSEGKGIRDLTRKSCDVLVKIPVLGAIDSLNVSQAAAVIVYEFLRKLGRI